MNWQIEFDLLQAARKVFLGGREISLAQQYGVVAICSIPMFLLAGASGAVFWVIGASFFVIALHATFYDFDALDLMEDQQELTGKIVEEVWSLSYFTMEITMW